MSNESDKELLELAAKAAGIELADQVNSYLPGSHAMWVVGRSGVDAVWAPLTDDGDALRLAVKLNIELRFHLAGSIPGVTATCIADSRLPIHREPWGNDKCSATRRAIVRAAAEIGRKIDNSQ